MCLRPSVLRCWRALLLCVLSFCNLFYVRTSVDASFHITIQARSTNTRFTYVQSSTLTNPRRGKEIHFTKKGYSWMCIPLCWSWSCWLTHAPKHLSWCLCCLLHEVGCCTSPGEERRAAAHARATVSRPYITLGSLFLMAASRPVYHLGLGMDQAEGAEEAAANPA